MSQTLSSVRTLSKFVKPCQSHLGSLIICQPQTICHVSDRQFSSAYVSRGFVDQNVKQISKNLHKSAISEKFPEIKPSESKLIIREPETTRHKAPLVLLFGWGGASHKNLSKYADIYLETGCTTCQYSLSTRYKLYKRRKYAFDFHFPLKSCKVYPYLKGKGETSKKKSN